MELTEKNALLTAACLQETGTDPCAIAIRLMALPVVSIHGPEHHFLDGAALLTAIRNAGASLDLPAALAELSARSLKMPGATCGQWGVCGSAASVGAALAILHGTGPLSTGEDYRNNLRLAAAALAEIAEAGGPRCCKRNAFFSLRRAAAFVRERYGIPLTCGPVVCPYSSRNAQCLGTRCPFHPAES